MSNAVISHMCLFIFKDDADDGDADDSDDFDNDVVLFYVGHSVGLFNLKNTPFSSSGELH